MNDFQSNKEIREEDILMSLDNALSDYRKKGLENIVKDSIAKSKAPKRTKTSVKKVEKVAKTKTSKKLNRLNRYSPRTKKFVFIEPISKGFGKVVSTYKRQILTTALTLSMIMFVGFTSYIAYAYVAANNNDVIEKVAHHVVLPSGETPKVYIIQSEKSEIFQNPLFKGIAIGDNVLSYPDSGKVIIYRSSEDKIVNIVSTSAQ